MHSRLFLALGAVFAALSVALSAAASHMPVLQQAGGSWTASLEQHQFHALGLMAVGLLLERRCNRWLVASGWLMLSGLVLFCLNIDARLLWGWEFARALVPLGGGAFILSWLAVAVGVLMPQR
jgi:uncharacterized membrane protein YgdD (TMEM256/DUF423 family)